MDRLSRISITIKSNKKRETDIPRPTKKRPKREKPRNDLWLAHIQKIKEDNPNLSGKSLFVLAKSTYEKVDGYQKGPISEYRHQWLTYWEKNKNKPEFKKMDYFKKRYILKKRFDIELASECQSIENEYTFDTEDSDLYYSESEEEYTSDDEMKLNFE